MTLLTAKRTDLILQQLEELPTLSSVAMRVLEVTGSSESSAGDVVRLIESDPSLTARILKLVHRADSGIRGEVNTVERAVVLMGFEAVRSAVLAISVFDTFHSIEPRTQSTFIRDDFWKHSLAVACLAELISAQMGRSSGVDASDAFVCGLLHDLGKIAFDAVLPKSFSRAVEAADLLRGNIADIERNIIGLDHMVAGKRLAERWNLPVNIRESIWLHGQTPAALPNTVRNARLINVITLADMLVREQHLGYSGNHTFPVPRDLLLEAIRLHPDQIEHAMHSLVDRIEARAQILGIGVKDADELYRQALSQANRELVNVSSQLSAKNRKLAVRAKFFEAFAGFQGDLRPDAPPQMVLRAIAQTASDVLGISACACYSLPSGRNYAECVLIDAKTNDFESSLIDTGGPASSVTFATVDTGIGPVRAVDESFEWLLQTISPKLPNAKRFCIALETEGTSIGGIVWGAASGESQRLAGQVQELTALASGWSLALRTAQIREEARGLSEQLAESNRQLQNAQSEVDRSKMLITVGEMAAGAAHEMNNPLMVISGRSQLLSHTLEDPKQKGSAHLIYEQSQRLSDMITDLMDFAKPATARPVETNAAELIHRALHEAKRVNEPADRKVELTIGEIPFVCVDPGQITGALSEILSNAYQATEKGTGTIEIHGAFDSYSQRVIFTVADNGSGMDEETRRRAFDPFFSAKRAGRRRGMGLAKALRWIEGSKGSIKLESKPGHGTRFIVLLPAVKNEMSRMSQDVRKHA